MNFSINETLIAATPPLFFVIALIFLLKKSAKSTKRKETHALQRKRSILLRAVISAYKPIAILVVFLYVKYIYVVLGVKESEIGILNFIFEDAYFVSNLMLVTWSVRLVVNSFKEQMIKKLTLEEKSLADIDNNPQRTKIDALGKLLYGLWLVFFVLLALGHFGVPVSSILAFGGMGSIVLGFAAKDLLGDFMSGFLIYCDAQYDIGEWIKLEDPKVEGTVEHIGWRVSRIRTFDDRPLYVPNGMLSKAIVQNVSRRDSMRIKEYITVSADSAPLMSMICKELRNDILLNHDGIDQERTVVVNLASYQAGVCWIYLSAFTRSGDIQGFHGIKQDILIKVHAVLQMHGVCIESPKVSVHQMFTSS
ncbi:mechanosensitive ion channel family protein [Vibrio vulnificus]|nr:mechanosensitive ion channel family protein [Vibrio vulnificus]